MAVRRTPPPPPSPSPRLSPNPTLPDQVGPYNKRASSLLYQSWVQQAGGAVKAVLY